MRWLGIHHCHGGQKSLGLKTQVGVAAIFTREPFIFPKYFLTSLLWSRKTKQEGDVMVTSLFECVSKEALGMFVAVFLKKKKNDAKFPFISGKSSSHVIACFPTKLSKVKFLHSDPIHFSQIILWKWKHNDLLPLSNSGGSFGPTSVDWKCLQRILVLQARLEPSWIFQKLSGIALALKPCIFR